MVEFCRPLPGSNQFRVLLLLLVWVGASLSFYGESNAKTIQDESARAYKRAALQQVLKPMFPEGKLCRSNVKVPALGWKTTLFGFTAVPVV